MPKATKKPATKKPATKKPATKRTIVKKPVAKKPARPAAEQLSQLPPGESEAAFEKFIAIARSHSAPPDRCRGDALLILANVRQGVASLRTREADIAAHLPLLDRAGLWSLPELALALGFAARSAELQSPEDSVLSALLARVYELRDLLLTNAEGLAKAGLFTSAEVEKIRAGKGRADAAQDCIALAALYRRHAAALRGKSPITAAQVGETAAAGTQAIKLLRPKSSRRKSAGPSQASLDRDLLYTLLVDRYRAARRAGRYLWEDSADDHVPALLSRQRLSRPRKPKTPPPPPVAGGATSG
jgi:hypothetical protein